MGLFGNLFSKQTCAICGAEVGSLSRHKLKDGNYICNKCMKLASGYFQPKRFDTESTQKHLAYMEKINELYEKEYAKLPKSQKNCCNHQGSNMIWFADELGMFEMINKTTKKSDRKELFRYDQIEAFGTYEVLNETGDENAKRYSEVGLEITMRYKDELEQVYPYPVVLKLPLETNIDAPSWDNRIFSHLNEIFGSDGGKIMDTATSVASNILGAPLGAMLPMAAGFTDANRAKYAKLADDAEKRALGKTIKELLK